MAQIIKAVTPASAAIRAILALQVPRCRAVPVGFMAVLITPFKLKKWLSVMPAMHRIAFMGMPQPVAMTAIQQSLTRPGRPGLTRIANPFTVPLPQWLLITAPPATAMITKVAAAE